MRPKAHRSYAGSVPRVAPGQTHGCVPGRQPVINHPEA
jgi:hypothetical protein